MFRVPLSFAILWFFVDIISFYCHSVSALDCVVMFSGNFVYNMARFSLLPHDHFNTVQLTMENNLQLYPKFNNLVRLTLGQWCLDANFYGLMVFLQTSPKLEKLTLKIEKVNLFLQMSTDPS